MEREKGRNEVAVEQETVVQAGKEICEFFYLH